MDPRGILETAADQGPFVFLETARVVEGESRSYLFLNPVKILEVHTLDQLEEAANLGEKALREGYWLAGYWAYELGYILEPRLNPLLASKRPTGPLMWVGVFERPRIWEHAPEGPSHLLSGIPDLHSRMGRLRLDTTRSLYISAISKIKDYIRQGHTYQVNYTVRGRFDYSGDPLDMFLALRAQQAVSYAGYISTGERTILSLSPELFFHRKGEWIWSRPMKGTIKRGRTLSEDREMALFLHRDPKNRAENVMIVDLLRNDIGRLCRMGTVRVPELFTVERYQTLFQMTSTVKGRLEGDPRWFSLLKSLFPCGSVTGAPKIRTMEIISELETSPRDVYTGSLGFFSPHGEGCLNVAIRTVILKNGTGELGIGSGITMDSDPEGEFEECILKAAFLKRPFREFELIETLKWDPETGYALLERHLSRLEESAEYFSFWMNRMEVSERLASASFKFSRVPQRVRLTLSRDGKIKISASPLDETPVPVRFDMAKERVDPSDPFLFHKTTNRDLFDREHQRAAKQGLFDTIFLNKRGEITQGAITNIFLRTDEGLLTPALDSGLLPGTLRQELLERGEVREAVLFPGDILRARAVFLGNSVRGLLRAELAGSP